MNRTICLLMLIFSALGCKTESKISQPRLNKVTYGEIDHLGNRYLELGRFSGTILIAREDSVIYNNSFGLADYEYQKALSDKTAFRIGKLSELVTAGIIRQMAEEGKLELNDPVSRYLPEINANYTIEDLLNHKTSFPSIQSIKEQYPDENYSVIKYINLADSSFEISESSELAYNLLGLIIERVSGSGYEENVQDYALKLGLENTFFEGKDNEAAVGYLYHNHRNNGLELQKSPVSDPDIAFSSAGLKSTVVDLFKIIQSTPDREIKMNGYIENDGFSYSVQKIPESNTTMIILSNRRHPVAGEISESIQAILEVKKHQLPLPRTPYDIDTELLKEYSGSYVMNENTSIEILNENDSLYVMMGPNKIVLVPQSGNQFYMTERDASLRFLRDSTGVVTEVELLDGFLEGMKIRRLR